MDYFRGRLHAMRSHFHSGVEEEFAPTDAPSHQEIARLAYSYWEARGRQHGSALEDWLRAEREIPKRK
jgi:hypothetical protein